MPESANFGLHIPDSSHVWAERLITRVDENGNRQIEHHGWSKPTGFGPWDEHRPIAIRLSDDKYLLKDDVAFNRIVKTKDDQLMPEEKNQLGGPYPIQSSHHPVA